MNKTSTLRGFMLDTYRTQPLTSRRLCALRYVRGGACEVPIGELYPRHSVARAPASRVPASRVPRPLI